MKSFIPILLAAAFLQPLAAFAGGDPAKGAKVFKKCGACHNIGPGATTKVGPELNGVVGRHAGSIADYPYSDAMKNSGLTFDVATLSVYLKSPKAMVPGTLMSFPGLTKEEDIANVIAYLQTFGPDGEPVTPPAGAAPSEPPAPAQ